MKRNKKFTTRRQAREAQRNRREERKTKRREERLVKIVDELCHSAVKQRRRRKGKDIDLFPVLKG